VYTLDRVHQAKDQWVNFNPMTGEQMRAGKDGLSRADNIGTDYHAWAPRVSFAYQLNRSLSCGFSPRKLMKRFSFTRLLKYHNQCFQCINPAFLPTT